jgi:hypothetical protein
MDRKIPITEEHFNISLTGSTNALLKVLTYHINITD